MFAMALDLNNADLDVLDELLDRTPQPLQPLDAVLLDGYLAGIAVQPRIVPIDAWMPGVFDIDARPLPAGTDAPWLARCRALVQRRFEVMTTDLAEQAWFDPVIVDVERLPPLSEYEVRVSDAARALAPWAAGFELAMARFPELAALGEPDVEAQLQWIRQWATPEPGTDASSDRASVATPADHAKPQDVTQAVDALVAAIARLWHLTDARRYRVDTIRREAAKVGRNDPCPCGSGRKYKVCHGAS